MNYNKKSIEDVDVSGKRVLCRCDFNVPTKDGKITSDKRIVAALPTIQYLMNHGAKVILCSHMGKPKGEWKPELSLKVVAQRLSELLGKEVLMAADVVGEDAKAKAASLKDGDVMLLENVRYIKGETKNDPELSKELASLADLFVNDAFGTAHRAHSSTAGVADYLPCRLRLPGAEGSGDYGQSPGQPGASLCGHSGRRKGLRQAECDQQPPGEGGHPDHRRRHGLYLPGRSRATATGTSLLDEEKVDYCKEMMAKAEAKGVKLLLPVDTAVAASFPNPIDAPIDVETVASDAIPAGPDGSGHRRKDHGALRKCGRKLPRLWCGTAPWACLRIPFWPRAPSLWPRLWLIPRL